MTRLPRWRVVWPRPVAGEARCLSLLHRLAIAYLMAPIFVWLVGWFEWWFGVPAALLLGVALAPALRGSWRIPRPSPRALAIVALALTWTMLTAHGGVFDGNNSDWMDRRALLLDLSRHPWPVYVRDDLTDHLPWGGGEPQALLRYYLAWYMVPGLAGRVFGQAALNWAVPLWTALGAALVLLLFAHGLRGRRAFFAAGLFVLFGGMDALRILLLRGVDYFEFGLDGAGWPGIHIHYDEWDSLKNVSPGLTSNMLSFTMAPHILAAALYALLLLRLHRHPRFLAAGGVVLSAALFWSPLVAIGLLPLLLVVVCGSVLRGDSSGASWSNLCLAPPLAGLCALHLTSGSLDFDHGWLWAAHSGRLMIRWAVLFFGTEFLLLLLFVLLLRPKLARKPLFAATAAVLLLAPWYKLGGINLTIQGTLPALVLLCHFCVRGLLAGVSRRRTGHAFANALRWLGFGGLAGVMAFGAVGPLMLLTATTRDDVTFRFSSSGITMFALQSSLQMENLAADVPPLLAVLLRKHDQRTPRPSGEAVFRGPFNIHAHDKRLVFVRERCAPTDRWIRTRFVPANRDSNARIERRVDLRRYGAGCGAMLGLPGWPVKGARVGQTPSDGGDWAVEVLFDEAGQMAGLSHPPSCVFAWGDAGRTCPAHPGAAALRAAYDRTRAAAPVARSHFNVYVGDFDDHRGDHWLIYVREPCVFNDMTPRFFLHLVPMDANDLPPQRRRRGASFDNRDFVFGEHGALIDGKCVAAWRLPYPVRGLRTGQFTAAGDVWSVRYAPAETAQ